MKKSNIIILFIVLIIFGIISIASYINQDDEPGDVKNPEQTNDKTETKAPGDEENDKPLSNKQYETILKNFYDAKNFAIDETDATFLNNFLEKGNNYTSEILNEVKDKKKVNYEVVIFKEVIDIKKNVHTVKFEILNGDEKKEKVYMIKREGNFRIVGEQ